MSAPSCAARRPSASRQVIALKGTAALWSPKVLRAGMGAHFALRLIEGLEPDELDALAVPLLATSSHRGDLLHRRALPWPCAWVMGHEGQGVSATRWWRAPPSRCASPSRAAKSRSTWPRRRRSACTSRPASDLTPQYISRSGRMSRRIVVAISSIDLCVDDSHEMPSRRIIASASVTS